VRPELIFHRTKTTLNRLVSGEIFDQRELHKLGVQHVGLVTHPENPEVVYERIILGTSIPDTQRTVFNKTFEGDVMHLTPDPRGVTGSVGFIDFVEVTNRYGSRDLQKRYGKEIHITYAGVEVGQRGQIANIRLFEAIKLIAKKRGVTYISAEVHSSRFRELFPIFKRLGFKEGTTLNDGRVKISCELV